MPRILITLFAVLCVAGAVEGQTNCPPPPPGGLCVSPGLFADSGPLGCLAASPPCLEPTPAHKDLLCRLPLLTEYLAPDGECFNWSGATRQICPKAGRYMVWRNAGDDIWIPLAPGTDEARLRRALGNLAALLEKTFGGLPDKAYSEIRMTWPPLEFDGSQCLPKGLTLGPGVGEGAAAEPVEAREFFEDARKVARQEKQARQELKDCRQDPACTGAGQEQVDVRQELADRIAGKAAVKKEQNKGQEQGESADEGGEQKQGGEQEKDGEESSSSSELTGSGGLLPAGAPAWVADLFQMVLTYFGVNDIVQGAAMALFMLAPDLVTSLAELSAGLTKDLSNDDLDKAFAAIRQLYQIYNTAQNLMASFEEFASSAGFDSAAEMIDNTSRLIEALPEELQEELKNAVGQDIANTLSNLGDAARKIDPKMIEGVIRGEGQAWVAEAVERKVRDTVIDHVTRELAGGIGVDPSLFRDTTTALIDADFVRAGDEAIDAVTTEAGRRLGVDPDVLERVFDGSATSDDITDLIIDRGDAALAQALGVEDLSLRDAASLTSRLAAGQLTDEDLGRVGRQVLGQLPEDAQEAVDTVLQVGRGELDPERRDELLQKAMKALVPEPYRGCLQDSSSFEQAVSKVVDHHLPGFEKRLTEVVKMTDPGRREEALAQARKALGRQLDDADFPETARLLRADAEASAEALLTTLHRDAEALANREIGRAMNLTVRRASEEVEKWPTVDGAKLPEYVVTLPGSSLPEVPLDQALMATQALQKIPGLAEEADPSRLLAAAVGSPGDPATVLGRVVIDELGPRPDAEHLLDRLRGAPVLSQKLVRQAMAGQWEDAARTVAARVLGDAGAWIEASAEGRATAIRRSLEGPPLHVSGLSDEIVELCLVDPAGCLDGTAVSLAGQAVETWSDLVTRTAQHLADSARPAVGKIAEAADRDCASVLPGRALGEGPRPAPEISTEQVLGLFEERTPAFAESLARRLLCCDGTAACTPEHLSKAAKGMVQQKLFELPAVRGSQALSDLVRDQGASPEALFTPAVESAREALGRLPVNTTDRSLNELVEDVRAAAAQGEGEMPPAALAVAGGTASSAAAVKFLAIQDCVLADDGRNGVWCATSGSWAKPAACARRMKECRDAIEGPQKAGAAP